MSTDEKINRVLGDTDGVWWIEGDNIVPVHKVNPWSVLRHAQMHAAEERRIGQVDYDCGTFLMTGEHDCHRMPENVKCETDALNHCVGGCQCYCSRLGRCRSDN